MAGFTTAAIIGGIAAAGSTAANVYGARRASSASERAADQQQQAAREAMQLEREQMQAQREDQMRALQYQQQAYQQNAANYQRSAYGSSGMAGMGGGPAGMGGPVPYGGGGIMQPPGGAVQLPYNQIQSQYGAAGVGQAAMNNASAIQAGVWNQMQNLHSPYTSAGAGAAGTLSRLLTPGGGFMPMRPSQNPATQFYMPPGSMPQRVPLGSTMVPFRAFRRGGVVREPTLALIGEEGPEAVLPLAKYERDWNQSPVVWGNEAGMARRPMRGGAGSDFYNAPEMKTTGMGIEPDPAEVARRNAFIGQAGRMGQIGGGSGAPYQSGGMGMAANERIGYAPIGETNAWVGRAGRMGQMGGGQQNAWTGSIPGAGPMGQQGDQLAAPTSVPLGQAMAQNGWTGGLVNRLGSFLPPTQGAGMGYGSPINGGYAMPGPITANTPDWRTRAGNGMGYGMPYQGGGMGYGMPYQGGGMGYGSPYQGGGMGYGSPYQGVPQIIF